MSDAEGQAAATAAMDQSSFMHMERLLREDTKGVYNVKHMLGRGGMAVVYLAEETGLSRKVALKVLPPELTFGHGVERFKREARTAAALVLPHIIPIYRIGDGGKLFWYAMKYLEGKSLEDLLKERGAMSLEESVEILEQVADALDYAHDHKVIHRDIKPANVMLDNRNRVIVTDFGIAKALSEGKLTATDSVIGTPYFMSPEQGMGKTVSGASDQYSVAVMAYRMLAGHVPFDGESAIDILHKHCMFPAPTLADDMPDLPPHVSKAVARALSKSGDERFLTVHDFIQAIKDPDFVPKEPARPSGVTVVMSATDAKKLRGGTNAAAANSGKNRTVTGGKGAKATAASADKTVIASSRPAAVPAPAPKSKTGLIAAVAVVVLAVGGIGAYKFLGTSSTPTPQIGTQTNPGANGAPNGAPNGAANGATNPAGGATTPPSTPPESLAVVPSAPTNDTKVANDTKAPANAPTATKGKAPAPRTTPQRPPAQQPTSAPVQSAPVQNTPAPAPTPAAPETGTFRLSLNFPAFIEIDGTSYGEKKTLSIPLQLGEHLMRVRKDGYETITRAIDIKAGNNDVLRLTLVPNP